MPKTRLPIDASESAGSTVAHAYPIESTSSVQWKPLLTGVDWESTQLTCIYRGSLSVLQRDVVSAIHEGYTPIGYPSPMYSSMSYGVEWIQLLSTPDPTPLLIKDTSLIRNYEDRDFVTIKSLSLPDILSKIANARESGYIPYGDIQVICAPKSLFSHATLSGNALEDAPTFGYAQILVLPTGGDPA